MSTNDDAHATMRTRIFQTRILAQVLKCVAEFSLADACRLLLSRSLRGG